MPKLISAFQSAGVLPFMLNCLPLRKNSRVGERRVLKNIKDISESMVASVRQNWVLPLVAHNRPFDESCLMAVFAEYEMEYPGYEFHCTLAAARRCLKLPNNQLHTDSAACGFDLENHHHGLADAEACVAIALKIL